MLKGQDIILMTLLRLRPSREWNYDALSGATGLSRSQCHLALQRLQAARLMSSSFGKGWSINGAGFLEYVVHALKYEFPVGVGAVVRGVPTANSAPFVAEHFLSSGRDEDCVWPEPEGKIKGRTVEPIHVCQMRFVPGAPRVLGEKHDDIYEMLVCFDLLRMGQAREQKWAAEQVRERVHED